MKNLKFIVIFILFFSLLSVNTNADTWWNSSWQYRKNVILIEPNIVQRTFYPVEIYISFDSGEVINCTKEIRVVENNMEIASGIYNETYSNGYCLGATVVFLANMTRGENKTYTIYYGNPQAEYPNYTTDLKITSTTCDRGTWCEVIESSYFYWNVSNGRMTNVIYTENEKNWGKIKYSTFGDGIYDLDLEFINLPRIDIFGASFNVGGNWLSYSQPTSREIIAKNPLVYKVKYINATLYYGYTTYVKLNYTLVFYSKSKRPIVIYEVKISENIPDVRLLQDQNGIGAIYYIDANSGIDGNVYRIWSDYNVTTSFVDNAGDTIVWSPHPIEPPDSYHLDFSFCVWNPQDTWKTYFWCQGTIYSNFSFPFGYTDMHTRSGLSSTLNRRNFWTCVNYIGDDDCNPLATGVSIPAQTFIKKSYISLEGSETNSTVSVIQFLKSEKNPINYLIGLEEIYILPPPLPTPPQKGIPMFNAMFGLVMAGGSLLFVFRALLTEGSGEDKIKILVAGAIIFALAVAVIASMLV
jgi:hypothetical protein